MKDSQKLAFELCNYLKKSLWITKTKGLGDQELKGVTGRGYGWGGGNETVNSNVKVKKGVNSIDMTENVRV